MGSFSFYLVYPKSYANGTDSRLYARIHERLLPCSSNNTTTSLTTWPRASRELVFPRDPSPFPGWHVGLSALACPPGKGGAGRVYITL